MICRQQGFGNNFLLKWQMGFGIVFSCHHPATLLAEHGIFGRSHRAQDQFDQSNIPTVFLGFPTSASRLWDNTISSFFSASAWPSQLSEPVYFSFGNILKTWAESRTQTMSLEAFGSGMSYGGCNKKQGPSLGQCINAILVSLF
jgi:hypothetical protein